MSTQPSLSPRKASLLGCVLKRLQFISVSQSHQGAWYKGGAHNCFVDLASTPRNIKASLGFTGSNLLQNPFRISISERPFHLYLKLGQVSLQPRKNINISGPACPMHKPSEIQISFSLRPKYIYIIKQAQKRKVLWNLLNKWTSLSVLPKTWVESRNSRRLWSLLLCSPIHNILFNKCWLSTCFTSAHLVLREIWSCQSPL